MFTSVVTQWRPATTDLETRGIMTDAEAYEAMIPEPTLGGTLRLAEARWNSQRFAQEEAEIRWRNESHAAVNLRDDLLTDFRFAYRKDARAHGQYALRHDESRLRGYRSAYAHRLHAARKRRQAAEAEAPQI